MKKYTLACLSLFLLQTGNAFAFFPQFTLGLGDSVSPSSSAAYSSGLVISGEMTGNATRLFETGLKFDNYILSQKGSSTTAALTNLCLLARERLDLDSKFRIDQSVGFASLLGGDYTANQSAALSLGAGVSYDIPILKEVTFFPRVGYRYVAGSFAESHGISQSTVDLTLNFSALFLL